MYSALHVNLKKKFKNIYKNKMFLIVLNYCTPEYKTKHL